MDPVTLLMALSSLSLALKDLVSEKQSKKEGQETDWFRKSLNHKLQEIQESTGVSEVILSEVLEKMDAVHSKLEQKNVKDDMMMDVLKSYIDNDVKQMLEGDLCDQQKWILTFMYYDGYTYTQTIGDQRWLPEPKLLLDDLCDLEERKLIRKPSGTYLLTRKGKNAVEKGFIFTSHWKFTTPSSDNIQEINALSSNLELLTKKVEALSEPRSGSPDWNIKGINAFEGDWFKYEKPDGSWSKLIVKKGSLDFE